MRAVVVEEFGPAENMKIVDLPKPEPGPGEVVVRIAASGVNFTDVYHRTGLYKMPLPVSIGSEAWRGSSVRCRVRSHSGVAPPPTMTKPRRS